jgi:MFS family permease
MNFVTIPGLVGPLIGPLMGGWLVDIASWHWIFIINIPIGIVGLFFTYKIMPNYKRRSKKLDIIGFALFSLAVLFISLSLELHSSKNIIFIVLLCAILFIVLYVLYAKRVSNPLISLDLFKIRTLRIGILGNLITRLGIGSIPFLLPQMIQVAFFHSASRSGMIMMSSAIATLAAKSWVVPLVKRLGYKNTLITNTLILACVIALFALPDKTTPLFLLIPLLLIYGCVNSVQMSSMNTIALSDLTPDNAAGGNSLLAITQQLSMTFGVSVGASILRANQASTFTHGDIGLSFKYTFLILGFITLISTSIFFFLKKDDGEEMSGHNLNTPDKAIKG